MPKYYCDYCDTYLTHDSPSVRKTHCNGRKHKENVRVYYQKWLEEQVQKLVDDTTAAFKAGKIQNNPFASGNPPPGGAAVPPPPNLTGRYAQRHHRNHREYRYHADRYGDGQGSGKGGPSPQRPPNPGMAPPGGPMPNMGPMPGMMGPPGPMPPMMAMRPPMGPMGPPMGPMPPMMGGPMPMRPAMATPPARMPSQ